MSVLLKKILLYTGFSILLVLPWLIRHFPGTEAHIAGKSGEESFAIRQYGLYLKDVAGEEGIDFVHQTPRLDPRLDHILPQIASMGASVAVSDYDNDGWNDFYMTNSKTGSSNALYHNMRDGTFEDVSSTLSVGDINKKGTGVSMGAVWADYDNDGFEDLFVYKWGKPVLFRNEQGLKFVDVSKQAGLPSWINANAAIWFDFNSDGLVDLFIGGYYPENIDLWHLKTTRIMPESFEYANNGGRNYLFKNLGNGKFADVTFQYGLTTTRWTLAAGAADLRGTGYPDLVIANDYGTDEYMVNENGRHFVNSSETTGIGFAPKSGMNVTFGDIRNNGDLGIYVTNITEDGVLLQGNNFWLPEKNEKKFAFKNVARQIGIELGGWSYGSQFGDLNNDGTQDLYVANGFISAQKGTTYWYDYSKVTGGNKAIISDAANWPDMRGRSQSGYQRNRIWLNDGHGVFYDVADGVGENQTYDSRAVALVDLWNRGVLDIIVANEHNKPFVYKNTVDPENHWIAFSLAGTRSNRSAIGTVIELHWDHITQTQIISGGIGFCSQNQRRAQFGLGKNGKVDEVVINWPGGGKQIIKNPQPDQLHQITEQK